MTWLFLMVFLVVAGCATQEEGGTEVGDESQRVVAPYREIVVSRGGLVEEEVVILGSDDDLERAEPVAGQIQEEVVILKSDAELEPADEGGKDEVVRLLAQGISHDV